MALAHAARARQCALQAQPLKAQDHMAQAQTLAQRWGDARERSHVEILACSIAGQSARALELALAHLETWPRDALILSLPMGAFGLYAFSGMADHNAARVALCARHASAYEVKDWWFQTTQAWALIEAGAVAEGLDQVERALALNPNNANAMHALGHGLHEAGAGGEAIARLAAWLPGYDRAGILHGHLSWHTALAHLEAGDPGAAMATYLDAIQPSVARGAPLNVMTDAAAFLWRCEAYGFAPPSSLWEAAGEYGARTFPKAGHAFVDFHMAILESARAAPEAALVRAEALEAAVRSAGVAVGPVAPGLCRAAAAFAAEDYAACADLLAPLAAEVVRIGGSGAQREMAEEMLILAELRSGRSAQARGRLEARLARRPSRRDAAWLAGA